MAFPFPKHREKTVRNQFKSLAGLCFLAVAVLLFLPSNALADLNFGVLVPNLNMAYGNTIDSMYSNIFWLVTVIFVATEGLLILFMVIYRKRPGHRAHYTHGNKWAEIIWILTPLFILIGLDIYQTGPWEYIRMNLPTAAESQPVQVFAEQFAWNFRYAGPSGKFGTDDDITTINQLHIPVGKKILVHLSAKDVIHSFFIPYARIKMDAVPGMLNRIWFEIDKLPVWNLKTQQMEFLTLDQFNNTKVALDGYNISAQKVGIAGKKIYSYSMVSPAPKNISVMYQGKVQSLTPEKTQEEVQYVQHPIELACAQLCGLGHYRMIGYVTVETPETYDRWYKQAVKDKLRSGSDKWTNIWDKYFPQYNNVN